MLRRLNFNLWYFFHPPWDSGISPPELLDFIEYHPPGRAIDLGCGTGTNVITLARHGWEVTGIDFAPRAIQIAERKVGNAHVIARLSVGDVHKMNGISGPFDFALDMGCFHGVGKREGYLSELNRILPNGAYWLMYGIMKPLTRQNGPGLVSVDLDLAETFGLHLLSRTDGMDKRSRASAWFLFQRTGMVKTN